MKDKVTKLEQLIKLGFEYPEVEEHPAEIIKLVMDESLTSEDFTKEVIKLLNK